MNINKFKVFGELKYGNFPLLEYMYNEIIINDTYGLKKINKEVKTILDIGGNLGVFSMYARSLFPEARIISIEAVSDTFKLLQENIKEYNIETYNLALGDGSDLYFHQCLDHSAANKLCKIKGNSDTIIKSYKLKDLCKMLNINELSILKIDIEGGECFLYQDEYNYEILKNCDYFTMEYHTVNMLGYIINKSMWDQWLIEIFQNYTIEGLGGNELGGTYRINKMDNKTLYNEIYTKNKSYNHNVMYKYNELSKYMNKLKIDNPNLKILDAGCGEGWNLNNLLQEGFEAFGIEISDICCNEYLYNLPHKCTDIVSYAKENIKYDAILCFDVLEHISYKDIDETLQALVNLSSNALLGIANHSDIQFGHELHLIQEDENYWQQKIARYYSNVQFVANLGGNFYLFECKK